MVARFVFIYALIVELQEYCGTCTNNLGDRNCVWISFKLVSHIYTYMPTLERLKAVRGLGFAPTPQKIVFQKDAKWCILLHFGYKICSVKSLNIVWKKHEKMEVRDRPFNLKGRVMVFCFVQNFVFEQHKSQSFFFLSREA